jgi:hypothetical protein
MRGKLSGPGARAAAHPPGSGRVSGCARARLAPGSAPESRQVRAGLAPGARVGCGVHRARTWHLGRHQEEARGDLLGAGQERAARRRGRRGAVRAGGRDRGLAGRGALVAAARLGRRLLLRAPGAPRASSARGLLQLPSLSGTAVPLFTDRQRRLRNQLSVVEQSHRIIGTVAGMHTACLSPPPVT